MPATTIPTVTLSAPRLLTQGADLLATATFAGGDRVLIPTDLRFLLRTPAGRTLPFGRDHPAVRVAGAGTAHLAFRVTEYGDWYVRVQGSVLVGSQKVQVAAEALVHVASSPFLA